MPLLNRRTPMLSAGRPTEAMQEGTVSKPAAGAKRGLASMRAGLLETCSNPGCNSGWLQIWRSRSAPVFEGGWNCSPECTTARLKAAVARELDGRGSSQERYRHRVPLGLLMMQLGWISSEQLRIALKKQRDTGNGRLGDWLVAQKAVTEQQVTRALGLQWSCPVMSLDFHDAEGLTPILPRLFVDAFGALPLRVAAGKLAYLGFEDRLDPVLALSIERITGLRVECGLVQSSSFRPAHSRMLDAKFPAVELLEAASEPALVRTLTRTIERVRPVESRIVRVHDFLWLRMWTKPQNGALPEADAVQDVICTFGV